LFLNPQSSNSLPLCPFSEGSSILGFDAPQLFSLPPWAKAGIAMANIINAITNATVTTKSMRRIMRYPLSVKDGARRLRQLPMCAL
jgi:hypothetical protein